jgi:hypothetical protein
VEVFEPASTRGRLASVDGVHEGKAHTCALLTATLKMEVGYTFRNVDNSAHSYTVRKTREQDQHQEFHSSNPFIVAVLSWSGVSL